MSNLKNPFTPKVILQLGKVGIAALFVVLTMLQFLSFPGQFAYDVRRGVMSETLRWALTVGFGLWVLTAQVALVSFWKVINFALHGEFFTSRVTFWLNLIVRSLGTALSCFGIALVTMAIIADDPGPVVMLSALTGLTGVIFLASYFVRMNNTKAIEKILQSNNQAAR